MGRKSKRNRQYETIDCTQPLTTSHEIIAEPPKFTLTPKTSNQKDYLHEIRKNVITICTGPAGSGKTLIPVGFALQNIMCPHAMYKKLVVVRSVKEACGEEMGFLPGNIEEKLSVWMMPIIDNMKVFLPDGAIDCCIRHKQVEGLALSYARGRSLNDCFVIVDEAQNCTPEQILMMLTRIGCNSKIVINGDLGQSDLHSGQKSGLSDAIEKLDGMEGVSICKLDHNDIVRHPLISNILYRYGKLTIEEKNTEEQ
jgi:phosphate starvation-inducible PhoH-like protein